MLALTIRQPWAHAILHADKHVENRSWRPTLAPPFRIAVHAGKGYDANAYPGCPGRDALDLGAIVGEVDVVGFHHADQCRTGGPLGESLCSPWAMPDQWHWWLGDRVTYAEPIPAVGRLGLWEWQR